MDEAPRSGIRGQEDSVGHSAGFTGISGHPNRGRRTLRDHQPRTATLTAGVPSGLRAQTKTGVRGSAFPKRLAESPRTGFIEDATFAKLLAAVKEPGLRGLVLTAFRLGFRKSELQDLLCLQLADGWLRLFAGATKNGKARAVKLPAYRN